MEDRSFYAAEDEEDEGDPGVLGLIALFAGVIVAVVWIIITSPWRFFRNA